MVFTELPLPGAFLIELELKRDERGFFAHTWSASRCAEAGLNPTVAECYTSMSPRPGTLRGLHYQADPHGQTKLVRCISGAIFDVLVDLRPASPTYLRWTSVTLSDLNRSLVYVPEGFAHGYQTLEDDTEITYQAGAPYAPHSERGVRWDDPTFEVAWPLVPVLVSGKDRSFPDFSPVASHTPDTTHLSC